MIPASCRAEGLAVGFDGDLPDSVIAGVVGEGGVVYVKYLTPLSSYFFAGSGIEFIGFFVSDARNCRGNLTESGYCLRMAVNAFFRHDFPGALGRDPYMGVHTRVMTVIVLRPIHPFVRSAFAFSRGRRSLR